MPAVTEHPLTAPRGEQPGSTPARLFGVVVLVRVQARGLNLRFARRSERIITSTPRLRRRFGPLSFLAPAQVMLAQDYGLASRIMLNGVWVARRSRRKPPPFTITSRNRFSPACAPSAGPLRARETGTHTCEDAP
jgi:hypothetical protein